MRFRFRQPGLGFRILVPYLQINTDTAELLRNEQPAGIRDCTSAGRKVNDEINGCLYVAYIAERAPVGMLGQMSGMPERPFWENPSWDSMGGYQSNLCKAVTI
jgi:hypothetical protein